MYRQLIASIVVLVTLNICGPAAAQARTGFSRHAFEQPRIQQGEALAPRGTVEFGGYAERTAAGTQIVHIFIEPERNVEGDYAQVVRAPLALRMLETPEGNVIQGWAYGRTCGALYGVVEAMSKLQPPPFRQLRVWPLRNGEEGMPPTANEALHARPVSVWGYAFQADGGLITMTLTGAVGAVDRFVVWSEEQLADCWGPQATDQTAN